MTTQQIRGPNGQTICTIDTDSNGNQTLHDTFGRTRGALRAAQ